MLRLMKVLGTTDEVTTCELCGRSDLKKTVILQDSDGEIVHYGADCAARAAGWTEAEVTKAVRLANREALEAADAERIRIRRDLASRPDSWESFCATYGGPSEAIDHFGGFTLAREAWKAAA